MEKFTEIKKSIDALKRQDQENGAVAANIGDAEPVSDRAQEENITTLANLDDEYQAACQAGMLANAIRVEQGEYAVTDALECPLSAGTHHVNPCVIICAKNALFFGMAHFDSYRVIESLGAFFALFKGDSPLEIQLYGGKPGSDPLRTGTENKEAVLSYLHALPHASVTVHEPLQVSPLNLTFRANGSVVQNQFATGVGSGTPLGARMRLIHNIGGIVIAQQSRTEEYIPLNFVVAYNGSNNSFFLDRLAIKSMMEFDLAPMPGEMEGPSVDRGGALLTEEMRRAYPLIKEEMHYQQTKLDEKLALIIPDTELRSRLIAISPVHIGEKAEELNLEILRTFTKLYEEDPATVYLAALEKFNLESQYPLMREMIPIIAKQTGIDEAKLRHELHRKFGDDVKVMAYGVDVTSSNIVEILKEDRLAKRPGLEFTRILKGETTDSKIIEAAGLVGPLCSLYRMDYEATMGKICAEYNRQLELPENVSRIVQAVETADEVVKGNIRQIVLANIKPGAAFTKIANRYIDTNWVAGKDPIEFLDLIFQVIPSVAPFDHKEAYIEIAKAPCQAYLIPLHPDVVQKMSFNDKIPGVVGVSGDLLKRAVITVMSAHPEFAQDLQEEGVNTASLTKSIRSELPYKATHIVQDSLGGKGAGCAEDSDRVTHASAQRPR